jgi:hypothetical protein
VTGSIGVIMLTLNLKACFRKLVSKVFAIKSADKKIWARHSAK